MLAIASRLLGISGGDSTPPRPVTHLVHTRWTAKDGAPTREMTAGAVRAVLQQEAEVLELRRRYDPLSRRERQVMAQVVSGRLNKQAAGALGISEITVKAHRGKVMRSGSAFHPCHPPGYRHSPPPARATV